MDKFKDKCLKAFQHSSYLDKIILYLNNNSLNNLRIVIDNATDELQAQINQPIGTGEESIHNARVSQLKQMFECFDELYGIIETNDISAGKELLQEAGNKQLPT